MPPEIEPVEGMAHLREHLTLHGEMVAHRLRTLHNNHEEFRVGIALMGAAVPLPYILKCFQSEPELAQQILDRTFFLTTSKNGATASGQIIRNPNAGFTDSQTFIYPEDILDDAGTALVFGELFPDQQVEVYPAFHKPHSLEQAAKVLLPNVSVHPFEEIPKKWVFAAGMDGGTPRLTGLDEFDRIELALLQRFSRHGYAYVNDNNPPHDKLISFLKQSQLPTDPELRWIFTHMERAKMHGNLAALEKLSSEYLKYIRAVTLSRNDDLHALKL
ncbi:hypothetical protein COY16_03905 [Candidatus Roizmanbacteria bacterium CG_4_10_14_0_2_um_filter_39_13]|uniref:Uncharacterized protein n=1 Tax=Candidatus Roizmanbacteria bacterium CG_4_10_14_0_2_um_filter_39_13 TaxID=1974825 RepID=A0A2M7TY88_9BACT|nr:MAG: hypothetical protein COY16_03905 [Candidatus Roizmanbacteria bacterium CG_4_10_14_0_2_um_filter_39_13]